MYRLKICIVFLAWALFRPISGSAQVRLPRLVRDSMVLQRNMPVKLWGWSSPKERIRVRFRGKSLSAQASADGKWEAVFPAMKEGGPFDMEIQGKNTIKLKDILVGDVWLCSGQSNMVHQLGVHNITYAKDIAEANFPEIRQFWVPNTTSISGPLEDLPGGSWKWANPKDINDFSAVAYFFARNIYEKYHVPIGIINASVGGTTIEAWMSEDAFGDFRALEKEIKRNKDTTFINGLRRPRVKDSDGLRPETDKGLAGPVKWYDPAYMPKGWRTINIPGYWEDQGIRDLNGAVWYRREVEVPEAMTGKPVRLFMGRIVDADEVYINGVKVGSTSYQYPQRRYTIPAGVLKPGSNLIVIRVENSAGKGGFVPDKPYSLEAGDNKIDLKGCWQYKVGLVFRPRRGGPASFGFSEQSQPAALYNAMIAPFADYTIKGVLWYQGESNLGNGKEYGKMLASLIHGWRGAFSRPDLPFYYVQLPNFGDMSYLPSESGWAVVREAALNALSIPHTGMAVTIDLGEWNDIHPDDKKDVGDRLALIARHFDYGEKDLVYSGPLYRSSETEENKIIVNFTNTGSGLVSHDGEDLSEFAIAGADKKFVWAKARIVGDKVEVWSDEVSDPKYVRYAWADNPVDPNLYNKEGLPASPFRTDK